MRRLIACLCLALGWWSSVYPAGVPLCRWGKDPVSKLCPLKDGEVYGVSKADQEFSVAGGSGAWAHCLSPQPKLLILDPNGVPSRVADCCNPLRAPFPAMVETEAPPCWCPDCGDCPPAENAGHATEIYNLRAALAQKATHDQREVASGEYPVATRGNWCTRHKWGCGFLIGAGVALAGALVRGDRGGGDGVYISTPPPDDPPGDGGDGGGGSDDEGHD